MKEEVNIRVLDVARSLAFVGDLSMGQPTDHSTRTAWLAAHLITEAGLEPKYRDIAIDVSLLRWSGCTANAEGFSKLIGDDIMARAAMLARRPHSPIAIAIAHGEIEAISQLVETHCEVSGDVARMLGLELETETALRHAFQPYDATKSNSETSVFVGLAVALAGDFEVLTRSYGIELALSLIEEDAGNRYPSSLISTLVKHARQWWKTLENDVSYVPDDFLASERKSKMTSPSLIADIIDLKSPWMTMHSQRVAEACIAACAKLRLDLDAQNLLRRAALIHAMGRASVPNVILDKRNKLTSADWEAIRLIPYWTARAGAAIPALRPEAKLASYAYERLNGSGYYRGSVSNDLPIEARILSAATAWVSLNSRRPWRAAFTPAQATEILYAEASNGLFDYDTVCVLTGHDPTPNVQFTPRLQPVSLSNREIQVLQLISQGMSNKSTAQALGISASTIRTHVESVFLKLKCTTRAAATLKASAMGLL